MKNLKVTIKPADELEVETSSYDPASGITIQPRMIGGIGIIGVIVVELENAEKLFTLSVTRGGKVRVLDRSNPVKAGFDLEGSKNEDS